MCAVPAARRLGAERIIALGRHEVRTGLARRFDATDVVAERGDEAVDAVRVGIEGVPDGYQAMDERTALKVLVTNG